MGIDGLNNQPTRRGAPGGFHFFSKIDFMIDWLANQRWLQGQGIPARNLPQTKKMLDKSD
jgi:hypothetical protein